MHRLSLLLVALLFAACGGGTPVPSESASPSADPSSSASAAPSPLPVSDALSVVATPAGAPCAAGRSASVIRAANAAPLTVSTVTLGAGEQPLAGSGDGLLVTVVAVACKGGLPAGTIVLRDASGAALGSWTPAKATGGSLGRVAIVPGPMVVLAGERGRFSDAAGISESEGTVVLITLGREAQLVASPAGGVLRLGALRNDLAPLIAADGDTLLIIGRATGTGGFTPIAPSPVPSATPTPNATPTPSLTPNPTPSPTPTPTPSPTPTPTPSPTPTPTPSPVGDTRVPTARNAVARLPGVNPYPSAAPAYPAPIAMLSIDLRTTAVEGLMLVEPAVVPSAGIPADLRADGSFLIVETIGTSSRVIEVAPSAGTPVIRREAILPGTAGAAKGSVVTIVRNGDALAAVLLSGTERRLLFAPFATGTKGVTLALPAGAVSLTLALAPLPSGGVVLIGAGEGALMVARLVEGALETPLVVAATGRLP